MADKKQSNSTKRWRKGLPPFTGWWNASRSKDGRAWRWFDAEKKQWGSYVYEGSSSSHAASYASVPAYNSANRPIYWRTYYPANARVPRVAPK